MNDCGLKCQSRKEIVASYSMKIVMVSTVIIATWQRYWIWAIVSIVGFLISLIPTLLHKDIKFNLPWSIDILFATVFGLNMLGILLDAYDKIPGFDALTQIMFSVLVAFFAFAIIYILHVYWDGLIMDKYAMAFLVVVTTIASAVFLEFIKWFKIFGRKQTTIEGVLTSLLLSTIFGIFTALIGVSLIKSGRFDNITEELGKQIDSKLIKRSKK